MKRVILSFLRGLLITALFLTQMPVVAHAEETVSWPEAPAVNSEGVILVEASTGTILYGKNEHSIFSPASTTKLMTALLAIEQIPLTDIITCSYDSVHKIGWDSSRIGLVEGEQIQVEDALYAILLASANEVSYAMAEHIGGTYQNFINMMNERAKELGCINTNFMNPHGLDDPEHYTTPYDLVQITRKLLEYPTFARVSHNHYYEIPATNLNVSRVIAQTHQILRKKITCDGVFAGKTGTTSIAGNCLVTCAERDGITLICAIMKSPDSTTVYKDTINLLEYGFANFTISPIEAAQLDTDNAFPILFESGNALVSDVYSPLSVSNASLVLPKDASYDVLTKKITLIPSKSFVAGENVIGDVAYYYANHYVGSAQIIFHSDSDVLVKLSPTPTPSPTPAPTTPPKDTEESAEKPVQDYRPLIIGIILGAIVIVVGLYLILIEIPYRRRKRDYYRNRRGY